MTRLESDRCQDRLVFYLNLFENFSWVFVQNVNKVHFNKKKFENFMSNRVFHAHRLKF